METRHIKLNTFSVLKYVLSDFKPRRLAGMLAVYT